MGHRSISEMVGDHPQAMPHVKLEPTIASLELSKGKASPTTIAFTKRFEKETVFQQQGHEECGAALQ
jgi:hypothetical protein